ncbi:aconitase X swivel domain-containing protein [Faecalispora jeddahensis]|uniref:aconitase X swivel domain-containing protein n=1 Tax=Faecalispora jeddahensis TaxID=1414721 RepID=UPI00189860DF
MFYQIVPETGVIMEKAHALEGRSIAQKVLIFPGGKGSSVVQADGLYQLNMHQNMPAAMIIQFPEPVLVSSAIIMGVPLVDKVDSAFYEMVKDGDTVVVNADEGYVEILS